MNRDSVGFLFKCADYIASMDCIRHPCDMGDRPGLVLSISRNRCGVKA